jgi:hypothetical protein
MVGEFRFRTMDRGGNCHLPSAAWQCPFIWNKGPAWCIICNYLYHETPPGVLEQPVSRLMVLVAIRRFKQLESIADRLLRRQSLYNCATASNNITPITTLQQADLFSEVLYSPAFPMWQHKNNSWYINVTAIKQYTCFITCFLLLWQSLF